MAAGWYVGAVVRIAGLLRLATRPRDGWGRAINADTLARAARIGGYFLDHALAAFDDVMATDPVVDDARAVLDWITRTRPARFTRRDLFTGTSRSRFRKVGDLDPALALLEQNGHIRQVPPSEPRPGRRPSRRTTCTRTSPQKPRSSAASAVSAATARRASHPASPAIR